jgi:arsenical pump membrane protein
VTSSSWPAIALSIVAILGMILRPWRTREWMWATGGAIALVLTGAIGPFQAWSAVRRGADVYAFLVGIMALAEIARREGLFDWLAGWALRSAGGSRARLFFLFYTLGTVVTVLLSNDTTAVVLTPAVYAALARTDADPRPFLYACAFIANAASFVLPISNPANLVVFGTHLPALVPWLIAFGPASVAAIVVTGAMIYLCFFRSLHATRYRLEDRPTAVPAIAPLTAYAVGAAALALIVAAALRGNIGLTALGGAIVCTGIVGLRDRAAAAHVARHVSWQVVPLVAGLFVVVAALDRAGAVGLLHAAFSAAGHAGNFTATLELAGILTAACAVFNNLPVALAAGLALPSAAATPVTAHAVLVAVDLGPSVSITGSLATILWLIALRRDGVAITPLQFLKLGLLVTLPALAAAIFVLR